jgi:hypothetical protein
MVSDSVNSNSVPRKPRLVFLKGSKSWYVHPEQIIRLESLSNYTRVFFTDRPPVLMAKVLKMYDEVLRPHGFLRTHRSHLINVKHIQQLDRKGLILMRDASRVDMSRRRRRVVCNAITEFRVQQKMALSWRQCKAIKIHLPLWGTNTSPKGNDNAWISHGQNKNPLFGAVSLDTFSCHCIAFGVDLPVLISLQLLWPGAAGFWGGVGVFELISFLHFVIQPKSEYAYGLGSTVYGEVDWRILNFNNKSLTRLIRLGCTPDRKNC